MSNRIPHEDSNPLSIEQLTQRYKQLDEARVRAAANLETALDQLKQMEAEAQQQFGTSDIDALNQQLRQLESENQKKLVEYEQHLNQVQADLDDVERSAEQVDQQPNT